MSMNLRATGSLAMFAVPEAVLIVLGASMVDHLGRNSNARFAELSADYKLTFFRSGEAAASSLLRAPKQTTETNRHAVLEIRQCSPVAIFLMTSCFCPCWILLGASPAETDAQYKSSIIKFPISIMAISPATASIRAFVASS
jgi:hypothetical protein